MRNQNTLLFGILAAGALAYYFLLKKKPGSSANAPRSTPSGGGSFVQGSPGVTPIAGAPVPNLQTALATQGVSALGQILGALTKSITGTAGGSSSSGSSGGGSHIGGGGGIGTGSSSNAGAGQFTPTGSGSQTSFYDGTSGTTTQTPSGSSLTMTNLSADQLGFGDIGSPTDVNAGSADYGNELNAGQDLQSVDFSGSDFAGGGDFPSADFGGG